MRSETLVLLDADLEYRLNIAAHLDCWCSYYLTERREVLMPELVKAIMAGNHDAADFVHAFVKRLHKEKCPTMPQGESLQGRMMGDLRALLGAGGEEYPDLIGDDPEG